MNLSKDERRIERAEPIMLRRSAVADIATHCIPTPDVLWAPLAPAVMHQDNSKEFSSPQGLGAWVIGCGREREVGGSVLLWSFDGERA
jgi:hypothetical protein